MKNITSLILLIASLSTTKLSFGQMGYDPEVVKTVQDNTFTILTTTVSGKKYLGTGFIINGEYLVTCYHVAHPSSEKVKSIYMLYGFGATRTHPPDSIKVDEKFSLKHGQYDFSKHIYSPKDFTTDVIVLKISKKFKKYEYSSTKDTVINNPYKGYALQAVYEFNMIRNYFADANVFEFVNNTHLYMFIGDMSHGNSGSPIFDSNRNILGMIQGGYDDFPEKELTEQYNSRKINQYTIDFIKRQYSKGGKLGFALSFNFLMEKYLNGYAN